MSLNQYGVITPEVSFSPVSNDNGARPGLYVDWCRGNRISKITKTSRNLKFRDFHTGGLE